MKKDFKNVQLNDVIQLPIGTQLKRTVYGSGTKNTFTDIIQKDLPEIIGTKKSIRDLFPTSEYGRVFTGPCTVIMISDDSIKVQINCLIGGTPNNPRVPKSETTYTKIKYSIKTITINKSLNINLF